MDWLFYIWAGLTVGLLIYTHLDIGIMPLSIPEWALIIIAGLFWPIVIPAYAIITYFNKRK